MKWLAYIVWFIAWFVIHSFIFVPIMHASDDALVTWVTAAVNIFLLLFGFTLISKVFKNRALSLQGESASRNQHEHPVSGLESKVIVGASFAVTLILLFYLSEKPSDYPSCILKELPGTENDAVALAKARKCKQQFNFDPENQNTATPTATEESRDCLIKHASSTTNNRAAFIIGRACLLKYGATIVSTPNPFDQFDK